MVPTRRSHASGGELGTALLARPEAAPRREFLRERSARSRAECGAVLGGQEACCLPTFLSPGSPASAPASRSSMRTMPPSKDFLEGSVKQGLQHAGQGSGKCQFLHLPTAALWQVSRPATPEPGFWVNEDAGPLSTDLGYHPGAFHHTQNPAPSTWLLWHLPPEPHGPTALRIGLVPLWCQAGHGADARFPDGEALSSPPRDKAGRGGVLCSWPHPGAPATAQLPLPSWPQR